MALRAPAETPHLRLVGAAPSSAPSPSASPPGERRSPPPLDDAQLVAALREGDSSAAAAFYDRARPVIDRSLFRLLGRRDRDHDDLAQLSMIEAIDSVERFRGECALDGWIATVTAHTVYKHLRRRKTEARIFGPEALPEAHASHNLAHDRRSALRAAVARIRVHLEALEPNKAWTFLLHAVCGHDLHEIAEITDVSVAAAQGRLSRGRRELLARLHDDEELLELLQDAESEVRR